MFPCLKNGDHILARWGRNMHFVEGEIIVFKLFVDGLGTHRLLLRLPSRGHLFFLEGGDAEAVYSIIPSGCVKAKVLAFKNEDGVWLPCGVVRLAQEGLTLLLLRRLLRLLCPLVERCLTKWSARAERASTNRSVPLSFITFLFQCAVPSLLFNIFLHDHRELSKCVRLLARRVPYYLSSVPFDWTGALSSAGGGR
ncbi:MAG: hypothetical protein DDT30_01396 [Dehalococcoidia bacterium]|nr:hypothetical protein [Bacillota bacterium]MBT9143419.1 hypothetical protein [Bacillota bacterium]